MTTDIKQVLDTRGKRYGDFADNAEVTGAFLHLLLSYLEKRDDGQLKLTSPQFKALLLIITKIARIVNGDPTYIDNWVDIAGYSQLVVNHLQNTNKGT